MVGITCFCKHKFSTYISLNVTLSVTCEKCSLGSTMVVDEYSIKWLFMSYFYNLIEVIISVNNNKCELILRIPKFSQGLQERGQKHWEITSTMILIMSFQKCILTIVKPAPEQNNISNIRELWLNKKRRYSQTNSNRISHIHRIKK